MSNEQNNKKEDNESKTKKHNECIINLDAFGKYHIDQSVIILGNPEDKIRLSR